MEKLMRRIQGKNIVPKGKEKAVPLDDASAKSLRKAVDRNLEARNEPYWRKITGFHPSYHNTCKRWWYLLFKGAESQPMFPPRTYRIFDNGHDVHARWRAYFDSMGILIDSEVEISIDDPVPIRGHADGILDWGGRKLYELKSISPTRYEFRKAYKKPDQNTYIQAQLYLYGLDLEEGYVIYECKGTQDVTIFPIKRDEAVIQKELRRMKKINQMVIDNKMPKRPYKRDSVQCMDCDLQKYCWDKLED